MLHIRFMPATNQVPKTNDQRAMTNITHAIVGGHRESMKIVAVQRVKMCVRQTPKLCDTLKLYRFTWFNLFEMAMSYLICVTIFNHLYKIDGKTSLDFHHCFPYDGPKRQRFFFFVCFVERVEMCWWMRDILTNGCELGTSIYIKSSNIATRNGVSSLVWHHLYCKHTMAASKMAQKIGTHWR